MESNPVDHGNTLTQGTPAACALSRTSSNRLWLVRKANPSDGIRSKLRREDDAMDPTSTDRTGACLRMATNEHSALGRLCHGVPLPVLPLAKESYREVDRVVDTITQTLRVQKEDGPGVKVRYESRDAFRWPGTEHHLTADLKQTLEARFSHVPQAD
ncbi:hypothetical protein DSL72_001470 [Monilinia vaccinii-corymbosi]|uniref:Uncharacterized protein n=1 Tax=Monilinia vaccinii-corymbosi TaxID=61207 RepID=A0A8A3P7T5_9HELO|nr:hypothetical protein DSL72_001470 [Monilinia vaccinii-corymbosi]